MYLLEIITLSVFTMARAKKVSTKVNVSFSSSYFWGEIMGNMSSLGNYFWSMFNICEASFFAYFSFALHQNSRRSGRKRKLNFLSRMLYLKLSINIHAKNMCEHVLRNYIRCCSPRSFTYCAGVWECRPVLGSKEKALFPSKTLLRAQEEKPTCSVGSHSPERWGSIERQYQLSTFFLPKVKVSRQDFVSRQHNFPPFIRTNCTQSECYSNKNEAILFASEWHASKRIKRTFSSQFHAFQACELVYISPQELLSCPSLSRQKLINERALPLLTDQVWPGEKEALIAKVFLLWKVNKFDSCAMRNCLP